MSAASYAVTPNYIPQQDHDLILLTPLEASYARHDQTGECEFALPSIPRYTAVGGKQN